MSVYVKRLIVFVIIVLLLIAGIGLLKKRRAALAKAKPASVVPANVEKVVVKKGNIVLTIPALGVVKSSENAVLSTRLSGRVLKVFKQNGDSVKKGELLAIIDDNDLRSKLSSLEIEKSNINIEINSQKANLEALRVKLANLLDTHKRTKELLDVRGASIEQYNNEETAIAATKAQISSLENAIKGLKNKLGILNNSIKEIKNQITYAKITSPINGIIAERFINEGDMAMPGKPLFKISSNNNLYIETRIPSDLDIKTVFIDGKEYPIKSLNKTINGIRTYKVIGTFKNLVEGEYIDLKLVTYKGENVLLPHTVILTKGDSSYVFVNNNGKIDKIKVNVIASGSEGVVVDQDLSGKELISAMPDILLRVAMGVPVHFLNKE